MEAIAWLHQRRGRSLVVSPPAARWEKRRCISGGRKFADQARAGCSSVRCVIDAQSISARKSWGSGATTMHSENLHEWEEVRKALESNEADVC